MCGSQLLVRAGLWKTNNESAMRTWGRCRIDDGHVGKWAGKRTGQTHSWESWLCLASLLLKPWLELPCSPASGACWFPWRRLSLAWKPVRDMQDRATQRVYKMWCKLIDKVRDSGWLTLAALKKHIKNININVPGHFQYCGIIMYLFIFYTRSTPPPGWRGSQLEPIPVVVGQWQETNNHLNRWKISSLQSTSHACFGL